MRHIQKYLRFFLKGCISGVIAIVILSLFSLVYFNRPVVTAQPDQYTNYNYLANGQWSDMTEGWGFGKTNSLGYIDADYSVPQSPDILVLGSSHTEALQIPSTNNFVSLTEQLLATDADTQNNYSCLNLGVSGHTFATQISNLPYLMEHFDETKYVVIETSNFNYSVAELEKMLAGGFSVETKEKSTIYKLAQKIPYLRLLANQYQGTQDNDNSATAAAPEYDSEAYRKAFSAVAGFVAETAQAEGFRVIFLYHTQNPIGNDSSETPAYINEQLDIVQSICDENGICLINTVPVFTEHFAKTYEHAYGFANTQPDFGHLNGVGHKLAADALYDAIITMEEAK